MMHDDSVCKYFGLGCSCENLSWHQKNKLPWNKVHCWQWTSQEVSYWPKVNHRDLMVCEDDPLLK